MPSDLQVGWPPKQGSSKHHWQTLATQFWGEVHVPQGRALPQPSEMTPQFFASAVQVVAVQAAVPQTLRPPPPQVRFALQLPQLIVCPQPSGAEPQLYPFAWQVVATQGAPQTFGVPAPAQVSGAVQVPQLTVPPQPSGAVPQFCPVGQIVLGVQPQTFALQI